eukprot:31654_1
MAEQLVEGNPHNNIQETNTSVQNSDENKIAIVSAVEMHIEQNEQIVDQNDEVININSVEDEDAKQNYDANKININEEETKAPEKKEPEIINIQRYDDETDNKYLENDEKDEKIESIIHNKKGKTVTKFSDMLQKQDTLYTAIGDIDDDLPLPYPDTCTSKMKYHFQTFLVCHPRIYSLFLLYQTTWPRGLVILDMYTDSKVALSLYENKEPMWFMLSCLFIILPFVLVWTVSLRSIQKY